jgi:hypothetical protein
LGADPLCFEVGAALEGASLLKSTLTAPGNLPYCSQIAAPPRWRFEQQLHDSLMGKLLGHHHCVASGPGCGIGPDIGLHQL